MSNPEKQRLLKRFNLDWEIVMRAIEGGLVSSLAFLIGAHLVRSVNGSNAIIGAVWSAIAGLVVLQTAHREILKFAGLQAIGTFLGALLSALYLLAFPASIFGLAVCACATTLACYAIHIADQARLASAAAVVIMGVSILSKRHSPLLNAELRFVESLIGLSLAVLVSYSLNGTKRLLLRPRRQ